MFLESPEFLELHDFCEIWEPLRCPLAFIVGEMLPP